MRKLIVSVVFATLLMGCAAETATPGEAANTQTSAPQTATAQAAQSAAVSAASPMPKNSSATASAQATPEEPTGITRDEALSYMYDYEAADFSLKDLDGNRTSLADHRGKIIFLNFWQTWCPPCREEMPLFERLITENDDVIVLAIVPLAGENENADKAERSIRELVSANGYTFPVLIEPAADGGISRDELYASPYVPANFVIDREGILRFAIEGAYSQEMIDIVLEYMRALDG